jgi:uncharacterized protein (TIGR00251 family)
MAPLPFSPSPGGVTLAVRLTPKAGRERIEGLRATPDGEVLAVAVTAPPEDGKANAALSALLAKSLRLPKSAVRVTRGGKSRNKTVTIDGDPEELMSKLTALVKEARHG